MYAYICATYEFNAINHVKMNTVHIFDISLNKCGCHVAHICSTALLLQCTFGTHIKYTHNSNI